MFPGRLSSIGSCRLSHDPNYIVADQETICTPVSMGQTITYTVHFQNTGDAPAKEVEVRTYLPLFFSLNNIQTLNPSAMQQVTPSSDREISWKLSGAYLKGGKLLRGTGEPGYGSDFLEEDTKDMLRYQVQLSADHLPPSYFDSCQSIVNRAEIIFDCNPSIFTNFYETIIECAVVDSFGNTTCVCDTAIDTLIQPPVKYLAPSSSDVSGLDPADLVWNWECSTLPQDKNGHRFCLKNRPPGVYHLTVKNTVNGCWAEKTVVIANTCPDPIYSTRTVLIGVGVLVGLFLLFRIFRAKKK
ncbi:MAG: DUF11 domain-containing protein [Saprospirales bacterium]|nr:DUF11 domain-containing protein [Saprospirales bacterium]